MLRSIAALRVALVAGLASVGALALLGAATTHAERGAGSPGAPQGQRPLLVRVLVHEAPEEVVIRRDGAKHHVRVAKGGLRVDGGPARARFRLEGSSPVRVGSLALRGSVEVLRAGSGLAVVNEVDVERYLDGTLGREMYGSWSAPALRAQAVASRTYALHQRAQARRARRAWDLRAGTKSQVYGGVRAESDPVRDAVRQTRGEILTWGGEPILAAFHSSSGGRTASAEEVWGEPRPYLVSVEVDDEWESPDTYWRVFVSGPKLGRAVAAQGHEIGSVRAVEIGSRTASGRVAELRLRGDRGSARLSGRQLRAAIGESTLKSTLFALRPAEGGFTFVGSGRGHGVGMSQWGARAMAQEGADHDAILEVFYPGAEIAAVAARASVHAGRAGAGR